MDTEILIRKALSEDIGTGDITSEFLDLHHKSSQAFLIAKAPGILAGLEIAFQTFRLLDPNARCVAYKKDGDHLNKGDEIAKIEGLSTALLQAERVALNFLQRLSGIATLTNAMVERIKPYNVRLLDTRKTTPNLRKLEKDAVRVGGGFNHRFGLYDMILIKENHIRAAGSITKAVDEIRKHNATYKVEVEVTNATELEEAVTAQVDRVMLDNMSIDQMEEAVRQFGTLVELEASGNVSLDSIEAIAATGVHYISSGAITHSAPALDVSLLFKE